jgi:poly(beta-D-mannuronate) lyase
MLLQIKYYILVLGLLLILPLDHIQGKIYLVSNLKEFNKTIPSLCPGDEIVLKNGVWEDVELTFFGHGFPEAPIKLRAETPGKVTLEGMSCLKLSGEYLHISGLVFTNGYTPSNSVIEFKNGKDIANNCIVSNCVIDGFANPEKRKQDFWIQMNGKNNTVEYCHLAGKTNKGMTLTVRLDSLSSVKTNHHIYRNYFGEREPLGENGGETIQIGLSETSLLNAWVKVEENFFEHCNGELEIISVKSCENLIVNNVFKECKGMLTLRHGHRNTVYGNIFLGNGVKGTGGIRIINENQKVFNNFFSGLRGKGVCGPLVLVNGVPNSNPKEYMQVKNAVVFNNTFYDCYNPFQFGVGNGPNRGMRPINTLIANNLVYCLEADSLIQAYDLTDGILLVNNLMINKGGIMAGTNMVKKEVKLVKGKSLTIPVSVNIGTIPNESLLDRNNYGPTWWQKK